MAQFIYIQNYGGIGTIGISRNVFSQIAQTATNGVKGAMVYNKKGRVFQLHKPIQVLLKNGQVDIKISVVIKKDANVNDVCLRIQQEVANSLSLMAELIPFNILVKVESIQ